MLESGLTNFGRVGELLKTAGDIIIIHTKRRIRPLPGRGSILCRGPDIRPGTGFWPGPKLLTIGPTSQAYLYLKSECRSMRLIALLLFVSLIACTPAVFAQGCDWSGTWITGWTGQSAPSNVNMDLHEASPNVFAGTYQHDEGQIVDATVNGNVLSGTWIQSGGLHTGSFEFRMNADCSSFEGTWTSDEPEIGGGEWNGQRP